MAREREVKVTILGEDKGGAKVLKDVEGAAAKVGPVTLDADKSLGQITSTLTSRLPVGGKQAKSMLDGLGGSLKEMPPLALAGAGAALALGAGLAKMASDGIDKFQSQTAEVRKLKAALGSTAEEASGMRNVAVGLGIDVDALSKGTAKLSVNLEKTGGDLAGVHVETAKNADGTTNLVKTWDNLRATYQAIQDPQQKNIFLQQALSKGGIELRGVLSATNAEYDKMKKRGPIYSDADLKAGRDLSIAQRELGQSVSKLETDLARGLIPVLTMFANMTTDAVSAVDELKSHLGPVSGALGLLAKSVSPVVLAYSLLHRSHKDGGQAADEARTQFENEAAGLKMMGDQVSAAEEKQGSLSKEHQKAAAEAEKYKQKIDDMATSIASSFTVLGDVTVDLQKNETDLALGFDRSKTAADQLKQAVDILIGVHLTAEQTAITWEQKIDDTTKALLENKGQLDITTDAGRKNQSAIIDLIQAGLAHVDALQREGASSDQVAAAYADHVAALRNVMTQAGFTTSQIEDLISKYQLLARQPDIVKNITTYTQTVNLGETARSPGGRGVTPEFALGLEMGPVPGPEGQKVPIFAHGGEYVLTRAQMASLRSSGTASVGQRTADAMGSVAGGGTVNVYVSGHVVTERELVDAVQAGLLQKQRRVSTLGLS